MKKNLIVVTGAGSGLGAAIVAALWEEDHNHVFQVFGPESVDGYDLLNEAEISRLSEDIRDWSEGFNFLDTHRILINCAGINYIEWFPSAAREKFDELIGLNLRAPIYLTQELIGYIPPIGEERDENWFQGAGTVLNIVSNASHMPMTNSTYYNASKGAMHIATLAMGRELRKTHGLTVFGISPNKLSGTGMSDYIEARVPSLRGWTPEQAAAYQLGALPAGEETDPATLADFIRYLLSDFQNHKYLTNTIIPYGA